MKNNTPSAPTGSTETTAATAPAKPKLTPEQRLALQDVSTANALLAIVVREFKADPTEARRDRLARALEAMGTRMGSLGLALNP